MISSSYGQAKVTKTPWILSGGARIWGRGEGRLGDMCRREEWKGHLVYGTCYTMVVLDRLKFVECIIGIIDVK